MYNMLCYVIDEISQFFCQDSLFGM